MQQFLYRSSTVPDEHVSRNRILLLLWLIAVVACQQPVYAQPAAPTTTNFPVQTSDGQLFQVTSDQSILRVLVGRNGLLARMGHNHVVVSRSITGTIRFDPRSEADAHLVIPVSELLVDETGERLRAGTGYESVPGETAKADTRTNMLRPEGA